MVNFNSKKAQQNALWTVVTIVIVLIVLITTYTLYSDKYGTLITATSCEGNGGVFASKCDPKFSEEMSVFNDYKKGLKCCISNGFDEETWGIFKEGGEIKKVVVGTTSFKVNTRPGWDYERHGIKIGDNKIYVFHGLDETKIEKSEEVIQVRSEPLILKFFNAWYDNAWYLNEKYEGAFCELTYYEGSEDKLIKTITIPNCANDEFRLKEINDLETKSSEVKLIYKVYIDEEAYNGGKGNSNDEREVKIRFVFQKPCSEIVNIDATLPSSNNAYYDCVGSFSCYVDKNSECKECSGIKSCEDYHKNLCSENKCDVETGCNLEGDKCVAVTQETNEENNLEETNNEDENLANNDELACIVYNEYDCNLLSNRCEFFNGNCVDLGSVDDNQKVVALFATDGDNALNPHQINNADENLINFLVCLDNKYYEATGDEHITITSITDDNLYDGDCDMSTNPTFGPGKACVHQSDSCHYYPRTRPYINIENENIKSMAVDIRLRDTDENLIKSSLESCSREIVSLKRYDNSDLFLKEPLGNPNHYHIQLQECTGSEV